MLALVTPATVLSLAPVSSEAAAYIKFDGIDGESTNKDHKGWIEIESFSWGVSRPSSGEGANQTTAKELLVSKELDKSSTRLFLSCATGEINPNVILRLTRPGSDGSEEVYYEIIMSDVRVVQQTTDAKLAKTKRPEEVISLVFPKVEISYTPDDRSGKVFIKYEFEGKPTE